METTTIQPSKTLLVRHRIMYLILPLSVLNSALFIVLFLILEPARWYLGLLFGLASFLGGLLGLFLGLSREIAQFSILISEEAIAGPSTGWYRRSSISMMEIDRKRTARSLAGKGILNRKSLWSIYGDRIVIVDSLYPPAQRARLYARLEAVHNIPRAGSDGGEFTHFPPERKLAKPIVFQPTLMRIAITHVVFALVGCLAGAVGSLLFSGEITEILWGGLGGLLGGIIGSLVLNTASRWKVTIEKGSITGNPGLELLGSPEVKFFIARVDRARTAQAGPVKTLLMSGRCIWSLEEDRIFLPDFFFQPDDVGRIFEYIGIPDKKEPIIKE